MNVLHVVDKLGKDGSSIHGVSRLFSWWFPRFDAKRWNVKLIVLRPPDVAFQNLQKQGIAIRSLHKGKFDLTTVVDLVKIIRKEQIDIVHLHGYGSSNFGLLAARITGTKAIVQEHFVDPSMPVYQIPFDVILARSAAKGIAVSYSVKEFMVQRRYFPEKQVEVIYNGAPLGEFKRVAGEKLDEIRDKYSIPRDYWVVGSVGRLDTQKGITYLIAAAEKLLKKELKIKFLIVGDGPLLSALRAQCADVGIANNVIFPGYCENIPLMQSLMHIQVFPSLWEGTPLTLIEAMSMGLAIVSTPVDGLGEILRHEENALVVPPKEDDLLAVAIERMIQDSSVRKQLAQRAADDSKNYDIQIAVDRIQHVYEECLAEVL